MLWKGYFRGPLELSDISDLPSKLKVENSSRYLNSVQFNSKYSLVKHTYTHYCSRHLIVPTIKFISVVFSIITPLVLKYFIYYIQQENKSMAEGWGLCFALFLCCFIMNISQQYGYWYGMKVSLEIRGALISFCFKKMLLLSNTAKRKYNAGRILNLISIDVGAFQDFYWNIFVDILLFPFQILCLLVILCIIVGPAGLFGFVVMGLSIPLTTFLSRKMSNFLSISLRYGDERVQLTSELINGIRFLKQYAWEKVFLDKINQQRDLQMNYLYKRILCWIVNQAIIQSTSAFVLLTTFLVYSLLGHQLTASVAFTSLTIFVNLRRPMEMLPQNIQKFLQLLISSERLEEFFQSTELQTASFNIFDSPISPILKSAKPNTKDCDGQVEIVNGYFDWNDGAGGDNNTDNGTEIENSSIVVEYLPKIDLGEPADQNIELEPIVYDNSNSTTSSGLSTPPLKSTYGTFRNVNFAAPKGKLTIICGQVGSGKTSLVSALIGEIYKVNGTVTRPKTISYTTQQAFLVSASLRENILFGKPYDKERYAKVIYACSLNTDLLQLPGKDLTEIGERGVNLSGGQKQRISLARALYSDSECFILDEPLSAVDPEVGKHLFDHCIQGMMQGKTRILVTHQLQFIPSADHIVVIQDGNLIQGTYSELQQLGIDFESIMKTKKLNVEQQEEEKKLSKSSSKIPMKKVDDINPNDSIISDENDQSIIEKSKLLVKEDRNKGSIGVQTYKDYISAGGSLSFFIAIVLGLYFISQVIFQGSDYWLSVWTQRRVEPDPGDKFYLLIYFAFIMGFMCLLGIRYFLLSRYTYFASCNLHKQLLNNVTFASCQFFDQNPSGRIMNRFSKDIADIDTIVLEGFSDVMYCGSSVIVSIGMMIFLNPLICIPFIFLSIIYFFIQKVYVASSRELKRMESIARSPIYSHISENFSGLATIRAFDQNVRFIADMNTKINLNLRLFFYAFAVHRWVGTRLELISAITVLFSSLFSIYNTSMSPGTSGLAVTTALSITGLLNWSVRQYTELEVRMNSVERLKKYIDTPREGKRFTLEEDDNDTPLLDYRWPQHGGIEFKNVEIRYRKTADPTLKDISFTIKPNEKIGIVGRTGAGKSTIGVSLFRMVEASKGVISIDGVDISKIGLHDLRSR
ncbi:hypothetical protein CYY_009396, partial [Polysphondylium violaceum]